MKTDQQVAELLKGIARVLRQEAEEVDEEVAIMLYALKDCVLDCYEAASHTDAA